jgi:hypothetical protein
MTFCVVRSMSCKARPPKLGDRLVFIAYTIAYNSRDHVYNSSSQLKGGQFREVDDTAKCREKGLGLVLTQ